MKYEDLPEHFKYLIVMQFAELVIGFMGNVTACIVILCSPSMRTLTDFYLLSLTISDLLVLIFGVFRQTYLLLNEDEDDYVYNSKAAFFVCMFILSTSIRASILTVTAFTVERYLAVCHPFFIQSMDEKSRIAKVISAIWSVAALITLLYCIWAFYYLDSHGDDRAARVAKNIHPYVAFMDQMMCFFLPILLITVLYILIGIKLHRSSIKRQNITSQADRTNKKTLMMFAVIIVVFFISWAPYNIVKLIKYLSLSSGLKTWGLKLISAFTYPLFSVLNPIIYVIMSEKFREALKDLLLKLRAKLSDWTSTFRNTRTNEIALGIV